MNLISKLIKTIKFTLLFSFLILIILSLSHFSLSLLTQHFSSFDQTYPGYISLSLAVPEKCFSPAGLAWDGTNLWVGDKDGWIFKLRVDNGYVLKSFGPLPMAISGMAWDETTQSLLLATGNSSAIYQFHPSDGSSETIYTSSSSSQIQDIAIRSSNLIFFIDRSSGKIVKANLETKKETIIMPGLGWDLKSIFWDGKYLWVADNREDKIFLIDTGEKKVISFLLNSANEPYGLTGLDFGSSLWLLDSSLKKIFKILVRHTDLNYSLDSPFGAKVQFIDMVKNNGPNNLNYLKTFISIPPSLPHQVHVMPVMYDNQHSYNVNLYDIYGQQVAYTKEKLQTNATTSLGYEIEFVGFRQNYFLYPDDLGDERFPSDVVDLYVKKSFPSEDDKYDINHPLIHEAAQEAIAGSSNLYWKYRQINDYVVDHLYYNNDGRWDDAPVVLQNGHGSCSEYTFLFIALCRAAGLPARYQGGSRIRENFPYTDDVFHRWAEVYFPNIGWVPVDVTWNDTRNEYPQRMSPYFGILTNNVLVTLVGGGNSTGPDPEGEEDEVKYLNWNYHCYNTWTPNSNIDTERRFIWTEPPDKRLISIKIFPPNPIVPLKKGIEQFQAVGYYSNQIKENLTEKVSWQSSNEQVGAFDNYGYFIGYSSGITTVFATDHNSGIQAKTRVYVTGEIPEFRHLIITCSRGGTTSPHPGKHKYRNGMMIFIQAIPETHYYFSNWTGDVPQRNEKDNPLQLTLYSDRSIKANFIRVIYAPLNFSGEKVLNRSLSLFEYINVLKWQPNPDNKNITKYIIYQVDEEKKILLAEVNASIHEYWHRGLENKKTYTYALVAVNNEGRKGEAAFFTVR